MILRRLLFALYAVAASQLLVSHVVFAMGGSSDIPETRPEVNADYEAGRKQIESKDWQGAIQSLKKAVVREPENADAFNYLGYASRQLGDYDAAFGYYGQALALKPNHRGANEYIGEAYLKTGNLAKAEEHLQKLDNICTFGCAEYTMLKRAVAEYKAANS